MNDDGVTLLRIQRKAVKSSSVGNIHFHLFGIMFVRFVKVIVLNWKSRFGCIIDSKITV